MWLLTSGTHMSGLHGKLVTGYFTKKTSTNYVFIFCAPLILPPIPTTTTSDLLCLLAPCSRWRTASTTLARCSSRAPLPPRAASSTASLVRGRGLQARWVAGGGEVDVFPATAHWVAGRGRRAPWATGDGDLGGLAGTTVTSWHAQRRSRCWLGEDSVLDRPELGMATLIRPTSGVPARVLRRGGRVQGGRACVVVRDAQERGRRPPGHLYPLGTTATGALVPRPEHKIVCFYLTRHNIVLLRDLVPIIEYYQAIFRMKNYQADRWWCVHGRDPDHEGYASPRYLWVWTPRSLASLENLEEHKIRRYNLWRTFL
jgi:hypothetical protein